MKALFLGHFAAGVAPRILAKVKTPLESSILDDEGDAAQLAPLLAEAEIVVGHIWRALFPPAPRLRLLQSVAAGLDLLDTGAVPKGVTICNVFGHEPAIAEYVIMTMLGLDPSPVRGRDGVPRRLLDREPAIRRRSPAWRGDGTHHRHYRLWPDRARGGRTRRRVSNAVSSPPTAARSPIPAPRGSRFSPGRTRSHAAVVRHGPYLLRARPGDERIDRRPPPCPDETGRAADQCRAGGDRRRGCALCGAQRWTPWRRRARCLVAISHPGRAGPPAVATAVP